MKRIIISKAINLILIICIICSSLLFSSCDSETDERVLFSGKATATFTDWSSWESAVSLERGQFDIAEFSSPFTIMVSYESKDMPILIFQSWSGGTSWADMIPSYISEGVAYYRYDIINEHYGSDFSLLNCIKVMPNGSDLTVTKVSFEYETEEINIPYSGIAGEISNNINAGWNLGNTLESHAEWITDGTPTDFETAWGNPVTIKQTIDDIKSAGFNAVRVPVTWEQHMDESGTVDNSWMDRVQEVVDYVIDNDMYCILNVHHDTGEDSWLKATPLCIEEYGVKFVYLWKQIATRFKDYDTKLLFEGFNEILDDSNNGDYAGKDATASVNLLNQMFVDTVRSTKGKNTERCLVVNTYAANTNGNNLDEFVLPSDSAKDSIIVEVHYYNPYKYCMAAYPDNRIWTDENGKDNINGTLYNLYRHFTSKGIPVIIGEFGVSNKNNITDRCEYTEYLVTQAKSYGIKCFWWDQGGDVSPDAELGYYTGTALYDRFNHKWIFPELVKIITGIYPYNF